MSHTDLRHASVIHCVTRMFTPHEPINVDLGSRRIRAENLEVTVWNSGRARLVIQVLNDNEGYDDITIERDQLCDENDRKFLAEQIAIMHRELAERSWNQRLNPDTERYAGHVTNVKTGETKIVSDRTH